MTIDSELLDRRLRQIIRLLEILAFDETECDHPDIQDLSVMGEPPRTHFFCKSCKREIYQSPDVKPGQVPNT